MRLCTLEVSEVDKRDSRQKKLIYGHASPPRKPMLVLLPVNTRWLDSFFLCGLGRSQPEKRSQRAIGDVGTESVNTMRGHK